jgi:hypothetical protein
MRHWLDEGRYRHEGVTVPRLWVTITLSLLIHGAALFLWLPQTRLLAPWSPEQDQAEDRLQVRLAPVPSPAPATPPPQPSREMGAATPPARPPQVTLRARQPPVMTAPAPEAPAVASLPPAAPLTRAPPQTSLPAEGDLSAYVQARRLERGEREAPPVDRDQTQFNASIAANLPRPATGVAAQDKRGGGIFEIKRMNYDDAAFEFFGWNTEMGRKTPQLIEVRKGNNSDMRIAVVRRMISIIREYSKEDFIWQSPRRGVDVVLSARPSDNAALEEFLLHEFPEFSDDPRQRH